AQLRLIQGTRESAVELITAHRQLAQLFGEKDRTSPLGAALLPLGRRALQDAPRARGAANQPGRARPGPGARPGWGDSPEPSPAVQVGIARAVLAHLWGGRSEGSLLVPQSSLRALDVSGLPVPREGVAAVAAVFDGEDKLQELLITYRPNVN